MQQRDFSPIVLLILLHRPVLFGSMPGEEKEKFIFFLFLGGSMEECLGQGHIARIILFLSPALSLRVRMHSND